MRKEETCSTYTVRMARIVFVKPGETIGLEYGRLLEGIFKNQPMMEFHAGWGRNVHGRRYGASCG